MRQVEAHTGPGRQAAPALVRAGLGRRPGPAEQPGPSHDDGGHGHPDPAERPQPGLDLADIMEQGGGDDFAWHLVGAKDADGVASDGHRVTPVRSRHAPPKLSLSVQ